MSKFGNISLMLVESNCDKISDAEKTQNIERLLIESFKAYYEADRQSKISKELGDEAIKLLLSSGIELDKLLIKIKEKVLEDGVITTEE